MDEHEARALLKRVSFDVVDGVRRYYVATRYLAPGATEWVDTRSDVPAARIAEARAHSVPWLLEDYSPTERRAWTDRRAYREAQWAFQDGLRDWMKTHPWEWFGHLTFERCDSITYAKQEVGRWFNRLSRQAWGRNYSKRQNEGVFAFVGYERQKRGDWHAHFLAGGTRELRRLDAMDEWSRPALFKSKDTRRGRKPKWKRRVDWTRREERRSMRGFARIYAYDPKRGGAAYAVKYITKDLDGDWGVVGNWRGAGLPSDSRAQGKA